MNSHNAYITLTKSYFITLKLDMFAYKIIVFITIMYFGIFNNINFLILFHFIYSSYQPLPDVEYTKDEINTWLV